MEFTLNLNHIIFLFALFIIGSFIPLQIGFSLLYLILIPGFIVSKLLLPENISGSKSLLIGLGIGVSFLPIITSLYGFLSIPLNSLTINLTIFGLIIFFILNFIPKNLEKLKKVKFGFEKRYDIQKIILILILFLGLLTRIYPVKGMNAPLFADPAVEGTIARLIINNQGIPNTWKPFLNLKLTHQIGFASIIAWFGIFSEIIIPKIILFFTNILHGLFPLGIYLLSYELLKNEFQRITASIISLVSAFPTYIFVAGMNSGVTMYFLLPFILFLIFRNFRKIHYKELILIGLISTGCFLIHPIYLFLLGIFMIPYILLNWKTNKNHIKTVSILVIFSIAVPSLLFLPTISSFLTQNPTTEKLATNQWELQSNYINPKGIISPYFLIEPLFMNFNNRNGFWYIYLNEISISQFPSFIFGFIFTLVFIYSFYLIFNRKNKYGIIAIFWYFLLFFFGPLQTFLNLQFLGWQYIYPTRVKFLTIIPLSIILSFGFTQGNKINLNKNWENIWKILPVFLILILYIPVGLGFIYSHLTELSERKGLSTNDLEAINWLGKNTNKNSVILNTIGDVESGAFIGGPGQWIPVLVNRSVIFPATSLTENLKDLQKRTELIKYMEENKIENPVFLEKLKDYNISYVFLSDKLFSSRGKFQKINCDLFMDSNYFTKEYRKNGNCIFKVNYP